MGCEVHEWVVSGLFITIPHVNHKSLKKWNEWSADCSFLGTRSYSWFNDSYTWLQQHFHLHRSLKHCHQPFWWMTWSSWCHGALPLSNHSTGARWSIPRVHGTWHFCHGDSNPGWWLGHPSEKYESIGMMIIPNIWKNIKCSKAPTRIITNLIVSIDWFKGQNYRKIPWSSWEHLWFPVRFFPFLSTQW